MDGSCREIHEECGVFGVYSSENRDVAGTVYYGLYALQHRGQESCGIAVAFADRITYHKGMGLVPEVFTPENLAKLPEGDIAIGHVRYSTTGSSQLLNAQPVVFTGKCGKMALAHNGNLTNTARLRERLVSENAVFQTAIDSEVMAVLINRLSDGDILNGVRRACPHFAGAYALVLMTADKLIAVRDPYGIRPLCIGIRDDDVMIASESCALDAVGAKFLRDVEPGEIVVVDSGGISSHMMDDIPEGGRMCIFEYVYFARPDSIMNGVSVYAARVRMGTKLAARIRRDFSHLDIDVVIPIPETSCDIAVEIARTLGVPYRQGFVKNRYIGRTFIMPGQKMRKKSVRNKLNPIPAEFAGKRVLLVDDSIVRGTTSEQIVEMALESGARAVYFASAAPEVRYPNVYGIDMPTAKELIASGHDASEVCRMIHADALIYQTLEDLEAAVREENPALTTFETSVFSGEYITPGVDEEYFSYLDRQRSDDAKADRAWNGANGDLELYNI